MVLEQTNEYRSKVNKYFNQFHLKTYGPNFKYQDFAPMFKAELFNPDEWAELFKKSGAKYVVLTSKHHEGFTLWPSAQSWNWNSVDIGPHRDLCGDLTASVKKKGFIWDFIIHCMNGIIRFTRPILRAMSMII